MFSSRLSSGRLHSLNLQTLEVRAVAWVNKVKEYPPKFVELSNYELFLYSCSYLFFFLAYNSKLVKIKDE